MKKYEYRSNLVSNYLLELNLSDDIKSFFLDRTILVTGGAGAIGSNLVIALSSLVRAAIAFYDSKKAGQSTCEAVRWAAASFVLNAVFDVIKDL